MERSGRTEGEWFYLNLLALTGELYALEGSPEQAVGLYRKALAKEPDFRWVRDELLPQTSEKAAGKEIPRK